MASTHPPKPPQHVLLVRHWLMSICKALLLMTLQQYRDIAQV